MVGLEGLYIKWSGIKDISPLATLPNLRYLHIGSSTQIESVAPLGALWDLVVLEVENIKSMTKLDFLESLKGLEGLGISGSTWTTQVVESLKPIEHLKNLKYLFLSNLRTLDQTLEPISRLDSLVNFRTGYWWPKSDFALLRESLPNLKYGSVFEDELFERFSK
jgi:hypothetical protein